MPTANSVAAQDWSWSTAGMSRQAAVRSWMEVLATGITEMDVESLMSDRFEAQWHRYAIGAVTLNRLTVSPQRVTRSRQIVARARAADYDLLYIRRGSVDVQHCGRSLHVTPDSFLLLDNERPYVLSMREPTDTIAVHIADDWLRKWIPYPKDAVATLVDAGGWGSPLAAMLKTVAEGGLDTAALPRGAIADQVGSLLSLLFAGPPAQQSRHRHQLLSRITREIEARFEDAELTPDRMAAGAGISRRYLYALFAEAGTTFGEVLMTVRLRQAARLLHDRRYDGYSVANIAWDCGFADPSHFARRFRALYGASPSAYRTRS